MNATPRDDECYISHQWWLPAGSRVRLCLRFLIMAVAGTRWHVSWDRYPTSTGGPDWEKNLPHISVVSQFLGLSEMLRPKEGIFQGCPSEYGMQLLPTLRASGSEDAVFQPALNPLTTHLNSFTPYPWLPYSQFSSPSPTPNPPLSQCDHLCTIL